MHHLNDRMDPMISHVSLKELQQRVVDARKKVFHTDGMSTKGKAAVSTAIAAFFLVAIFSVVLPKEQRWIGLIILAIELVAWLLFASELRSLHRIGPRRQKDWLEEYDELAVEDGKTVQWISTFDRNLVVRSIETLKERALGEDAAFSMIFGPAGKLGLLAILGIAYTQASGLTATHLTMSGVLIRVLIGIVIAAMYALSWPTTLQQVRRDRLKTLLEFGLEQIDEKAKASEERAEA